MEEYDYLLDESNNWMDDLDNEPAYPSQEDAILGHESHDTVWAMAGAPGIGKSLYCYTCTETLYSDIRVMDYLES